MQNSKDCEVCGNPIPAQAFTCRFCDTSQSVENFPKMRERVIRSNLEAGLPTVEQALERLERDLREARACEAKVVRLIHGYGSSGRGGKIRDSVRRELGRKLARGEVKNVTLGENYSSKRSAMPTCRPKWSGLTVKLLSVAIFSVKAASCCSTTYPPTGRPTPSGNKPSTTA
jgi:hypothetical protein